MDPTTPPDTGPLFTLVEGEGPVIAVAVHDGHAVRPEVERLLALAPSERLREEDPYTGRWTALAPSRIVVHRSRFEVDMNRPAEDAVYLRPEQAWGLRVWRRPPPEEVVARSRALRDEFFEAFRELLVRRIERHGTVVVYDLHSYNHRRGGPEGEPADPGENPDVNLGTGSMDRERWGAVADAFLDSVRGARVDGRLLAVDENVRFLGGFLPRWVHRTFPDGACALAVEVKKFFMDEWTGEPYADGVDEVGRILAATVDPVLETLEA